jgi:hypothetical protein
MAAQNINDVLRIYNELRNQTHKIDRVCKSILQYDI